MRFLASHLFCALILVLALISLTTSFEYVEINDEKLKSYINENEHLLVYLDHDWKKNNKKNTKLEFMKLKNSAYLAQLTKNRPNHLLLAEGNSKNYKINKEYDLMKFPSIIYISKSKFAKYKGKIKEEQILDWLENILNRKTKKIANFEQLKAEYEKKDIALFYGDQEKYKQQYDMFFNVSLTFRKLSFLTFENQDIIEKLNITESSEIKTPSLIIVKSFDEGLNVFKGEFKYEEIFSFFKTFSRPFISPLTSGSVSQIMKLESSFASLIIDKKHEKYDEIYKQFYESLLPLRNSFRGFVGSMKEERKTILTQHFHLSDNDHPTILIEKYHSEQGIKRYRSELGEIKNSEDVKKFFDKFNNNLLSKYKRSEFDSPDRIVFSEGVYNLIGSDFEKYVFDPKKFAFVMFTRKMCQICDQLEEGFKEVANSVIPSDNFILAKIDGELNEFDLIHLKAYPTFILFFPGDDKYNTYEVMNDVATIFNLRKFLTKKIKNLSFKKDDF